MARVTMIFVKLSCVCGTRLAPFYTCRLCVILVHSWTNSFLTHCVLLKVFYFVSVSFQNKKIKF